MNVWAFSFDARLDDIEQRNRVLLLVLQQLERRSRVPLACDAA